MPEIYVSLNVSRRTRYICKYMCVLLKGYFIVSQRTRSITSYYLI